MIIEHASRRLLHWNVTSNPTAAWTLQQLREAIVSDHPYRFLVHDRDSIYAQALDTSIANLWLRVLKTPYRSPKANSLCERLIGSLPNLVPLAADIQTHKNAGAKASCKPAYLQKERILG